MVAGFANKGSRLFRFPLIIVLYPVHGSVMFRGEKFTLEAVVLCSSIFLIRKFLFVSLKVVLFFCFEMVRPLKAF